VTIDVLLDDVLLEIFDHYVAEADKDGEYEGWQRLVHVCQKWRHVVFQSPLRLNLRILCSARTPVKEKLAVWPHLPIIISQQFASFRALTALTSLCGEDNIIAALGQNSRVCEISLTIPGSLLESVFAAMQKTFVALKYLWLNAMDGKAPVVSDSFLGGSAPLIVPTLRELVGERVTEVLPNLQSIFLEYLPESKSIPQSFRRFIAARQLSSRPVAISHWTRQDRWSEASFNSLYGII
jgi:hypothetical protein